MKLAAISDLKKELRELPASDLVEICLSLAKYKKENKDFLNFLLFESHDKANFVNQVKLELDSEFDELVKQENLYYVKKGLRRILRSLNRYCKYLGDKVPAAEVHIYFCMKLKESGIPFQKNKLIVNIYKQQLKKIYALISGLHEDLRNDYQLDLDKITRF